MMWIMWINIVMVQLDILVLLKWEEALHTGLHKDYHIWKPHNGALINVIWYLELQRSV